MLDRLQPVAWMIDGPDGPLSRQRSLERRHRADLRWAKARPSAIARLKVGLRDLISPIPAMRQDPACCPA